MGGEKRAWYTLFVYAQFPQDFWEFENFRKISSITLTSARYADFTCINKICLSLTTLCADNDEGAMKVLSSLFAGIVYAFVHSS